MSERPYQDMDLDLIRQRIAEWERQDTSRSFDPKYMGRMKRMALREFKAELKARQS